MISCGIAVADDLFAVQNPIQSLNSDDPVIKIRSPNQSSWARAVTALAPTLVLSKQ